uniref:Uncharacterized protein n=1 Tax=Plectus sambesii TaxID=2011161 RepID=A0A914WCP7_9BILA
MAQEGDGAPSVEYSSTSIHPRPPHRPSGVTPPSVIVRPIVMSTVRWHIAADRTDSKTVAKPVKPGPGARRSRTIMMMSIEQSPRKIYAGGHTDWAQRPALAPPSCHCGRLFDFRRVPIESGFLFLLVGGRRGAAAASSS